MGSYFLNSRQHLPEGYERLTRLIKYQLHLPEKTSPEYLKTLIYHSQVYKTYRIIATSNENNNYYYYRLFKLWLLENKRSFTGSGAVV